MLSLAIAKLQEALEIIDDFGAHLPGIHVANAISTLNEILADDSAHVDEDQHLHGRASH